MAVVAARKRNEKLARLTTIGARGTNATHYASLFCHSTLSFDCLFVLRAVSIIGRTDTAFSRAPAPALRYHSN